MPLTYNFAQASHLRATLLSCATARAAVEASQHHTDKPFQIRSAQHQLEARALGKRGSLCC